MILVCISITDTLIGTVELSYGTPYLLSLDISKELTALVWLAGPLSGLIVQPVSIYTKENVIWKILTQGYFTLLSVDWCYE